MRTKIINTIIRGKRSFVGMSFIATLLFAVIVLSGASHDVGAQAPPPPPPAPTVFFDASSLNVISSGDIDLSWTVTNAAASLPTGCTASGGWSGSKVATGTTMETILAPSVTASETRTYNISCTGPGGTSAVQSVTVTIAPEAPPTPPPVSPPATEVPSPSTCPNFGLERTTIYDLQDVAYAYGYAVTTDNLGNAYMTGEQYSPERGLDMFVIKYRPDGNVAWARTYDHVVDGVSGNESGYGILVTLNGASVYVVGRQMDSISQDVNVFVRKYDGAGGVLWTQTYNSGVDRADVARAAAFDSAGNLFVAGYQQTGSGDSDMLLLSFNADTGSLNSGFPVTNGNGGPLNQSAYAIAVLGTSVYVTGYTQESISNTNIALWRYETSGALASSWAPNPKSIDATAQVKTEEFYATQTVAETMFTGDPTKNGTYYYWVRKILDFGTKTGTYQYRIRFTDSTTTGPSGDESWDTGWRGLPANGIVTTGFQGTRLTFTFPSASNSTGISVGSLRGCYEGGVACASDGIPTVTTSTVAGSGDRTEIGYGVSADGSGNVFVTGYMGGNGGDVFLQKYNADGTLAWSDSYNSGGSQNDVGRGVAVGNSGRVFVAGRQQTNGEDAFLVESFSNRNIPVYPPANPPLGLQDWTTTANYYCTDTQDAPKGWDWVVRTPCNTGSHIAMSSPVVETCLAVSDGGQSWYDGCCDKDHGPAHTETRCYATLVESGFFTSTISRLLYKGGGGTEWEGAYAVAAAPSSLTGYEAIANDVYVAGYTGENGGGAFLNKYSCNTTASPAFNSTTVTNFNVDPAGGTEPLTVKVDARASAGNIVSYSWDFGDGTVRNNASSVETYTYDHDIASTQTYTITLTVRDTKGVLYPATRTVTVYPNNDPIASFTATPPSGPAPLGVSVDGSASTDSPLDIGGSIVSFLWNWGDGTTDGVGERTTHTYSAKGIYTIRLTVTDNGGATNFMDHTVIVTDQYTCAPACGVGQVCGPGATSADPAQCLSCLSTTDCGAGYRCLGTSCRQGTQCPDGSACPFDGKCPETVSCNPLATGATCPDGTACPATGVCPALKYQCVLSSDAVDTQCYIEEFGGCLIDSDCRGGISGGKCVGSPGVCRYARCVNETDFACTEDSECAGSDGTCHGGVCNYVYDCAYGPGMGGGSSGLYTATSTTAMPKMPQGVQPDGQACTKPTPDAPNNCEGINGCLYYNFNFNGTPIANSSNSVANCKNTFEGGTGCVYYQYFDSGSMTQTEKTNCLPRYAENAKTAPHAGIPEGCFVMDKGKAGKEYDCSAIDGCYYYLDGKVDCRYKNVTAETCASPADCTAQPLAIASCNTSTNLCEYSGNGCRYEPNPKGAIACPGATLAATGGNNFVQCLLNKDAGLPGFLLGNKEAALSSCGTNDDCQTGQVCIQGTCYPACQDNTDCVTGDACTTTCATDLDCTGSLVCDAGICVLPPSCVEGTICPNGAPCPASGICPTDIPECFGATPDTSPIDATSVIIGLTTDTAQACKYDLSLFTSYASMLYQDTIAPLLSTSHSASVPSHNGLNTYFAQCEDASGALSPACSISFTQGCSLSSIGADCLTASGVSGTCAPSTGMALECIPICSGAIPDSSTVLAEGTTSTDLGLTTDTAQTCSYGATPATITSVFSTTGGTTHSEPGVPTHDGKNIYYAQCSDVSGTLSSVCSIPFDQGCSSSTIGATCFTTGGVVGTCGLDDGGDAGCYPVCPGATPATPPNVDPFLTSVTLGLTTDTAQTCSYGTSPATITSVFSTTGGTTHSEPGVPTHAYNNVYFAQCYDTALEKYSQICSIPFTQDPLCPPGFTWNSGTSMCEKPCTSSEMCEGFGSCVIDTGMCLCSYPSVYSAFYGECVSCLNHPEMPECDFPPCTGPGCTPPPLEWCTLHPESPACYTPPTPGTASCNTLGYTFTGTAIAPSGNCDLVAIILALLSWIAWIIALLAVLSGLRAGYLYITAMGNEKNLILAKQYLIYTTIGVGVSVLTFSIVAITRAILNI